MGYLTSRRHIEKKSFYNSTSITEWWTWWTACGGNVIGPNPVVGDGQDTQVLDESVLMVADGQIGCFGNIIVSRTI